MSCARITLRAECAREIRRRACAGYPDEVCGLLLGRRTGERTEVVRVHAAANLAERATERFDLDPAAHLAAEELAARLDLQVVGVWHSHPDRPARPSPADEEAAFEGWSWLIAAVDAHGAVELCAFRAAGSALAQEELSFS